MNLVDQKNNLIEEQKKLVSQREQLMQQLKDIEISIERYNGALIMVNNILKEQEQSQSKVDTTAEEEPEAKVVTLDNKE
jgi:hypothetical protein